MTIILTVVLWILFGWITSILAERRGRNPLVWFYAGMFFGVFALITLLILRDTSGDKKIPKPDLYLAQSSDEIHDSNQWYFFEEGDQRGPMHFNELFLHWKKGDLKEHSYVWTHEMKNWKQVRELPTLTEKFLKFEKNTN